MAARRLNITEQFARAIAPRISFRPIDFLPGVLYHYTTAAGFAGIVGDRKIRATNFSFMNDPSEIRHGRELVEDLLTARLTRTPNALARFFEYTAVSFNFEMLSEVYVCCFTSLEDDLSQWRAYGTAATERYAIGFNAQALQDLGHHDGTSFGRVEYDDTKQAYLVTDILDRAETFLRPRSRATSRHLWNFAQRTARRLARLVPLLKTSEYHREEEWRIVLWSARDPEFDVARSVVRPYLNVQLPNPVPVHSVHIMAPSRRDMATKAAQMILRAARVPATVQHSAIPFAE